MALPGRTVSSSSYRYGFNGKEKDKDMNSLTAYDYGFRIYNPAIGKFLSVDPLTHKYAMLTPYQFASNTPIVAIDLDGKEKIEAFFLLDKSNSGEVVTSGATAIQINYEVKTKTISVLYGKVDGMGLKLTYNIETKALSAVEGKITTNDIVEAYGQVGTKWTKGQIKHLLELRNVAKNIGVNDPRGLDKKLGEFDTKSWEALKEKGLEDLHTSVSSLLEGFLESDWTLQVTEKGGADIYRIFNNKAKDLDVIENGLNLKLSLLQIEMPVPVEKPKEQKPVKPLDPIDKRPITDHPEDTKSKRDAIERAKLEKPVNEKKKEN